MSLQSPQTEFPPIALADVRRAAHNIAPYPSLPTEDSV